MDALGNFVNIHDHDIYFQGCSRCEGFCCQGKNGFMMAPLILDDFEEVFEHFPIVFAFHESHLNVFMLINDGQSACRYLSANGCSIYDHRPPACKLYPISPYYEHILVDTSCPSVNFSHGTKLCRQGKLHQAFQTRRLENFVAKRAATQAFLRTLDCQRDLSLLGEVSGIQLYAYAGTSAHRCMAMHRHSLQYLSLIVQNGSITQVSA